MVGLGNYDKSAHNNASMPIASKSWQSHRCWTFCEIIRKINYAMLEFEWDENKNKSNREKHSISFEKAKEAFQDENAVEFRGDSSTELRIMRT